MDYSTEENAARTNAEQSETPTDFRVSYESLLRGKKLAPPSQEPNPVNRLYDYCDGPYFAHFDRVEEEWHIRWDGNNLEPLLRFAAHEEHLAADVVRWLAARWLLTAGRKVYFIGRANRVGEAVKIGIAFEPEKRLRSLQTGYPYPLVILATTKGDRFLEDKLHRRYAHTRLNGEWFTITDGLKRLIASYANV